MPNQGVLQKQEIKGVKNIKKKYIYKYIMLMDDQALNLPKYSSIEKWPSLGRFYSQVIQVQRT